MPGIDLVLIVGVTVAAVAGYLYFLAGGAGLTGRAKTAEITEPLPSGDAGKRQAPPVPGSRHDFRLFRVGGGNVYHLKPGRNLIGRERSACDIVCGYDPAISGVHLRLDVSGTGVAARDMGSTNGTLVNGYSIDGPAPLAHGDEITIGVTTLRIIAGTASLADTRHTRDA